MENSSLSIPYEILADKTLTLSQKVILSFIKENPKLSLFQIANRLNTGRLTIKHDLTSLLDQHLVIRENGQGRSRVYSTTRPESRMLFTNVNNSKINNNNNFKISFERSEKLIYNFLDKADACFKFWVARGMRKHREGSKTHQKAIETLTELFTQKYFAKYESETLHNPLINQRKRFDIEDFKTSIDNFITCCEDPKYYPPYKEAIQRLRKKLNLDHFIYNPFSKSELKSIFLQHLEPPRPINIPVAKYPKTAQRMITAFEDYMYPQVSEAIAIRVTNRYGDILQEEGLLPHIRKYDRATFYLEFVEHICPVKSKFNPKWMLATWWWQRFMLYLSEKGHIDYADKRGAN